MERYITKAYAKINLGLDVLGRLPNGYHEVKMVMQTVGIYDELTFEEVKDGISIVTDSDEISGGSDNLIYKAARLLFDQYKITSGIRIRLKKSIPVAAGMAGGSADAAAALKGINEMFRLGCTEAELKNMGLKLGADVPYCVMGGTALAEGIGERLTALDEAPQCVLLVAKPAINVSTKYVYQRLDDLETYEHPDIDGMVKAISEGSLEGIVSRLGNVLESVTVPEYPIINDIKRIMLESGAMGSLMSGSGPAVFGIYGDRADAGTALRKLGEYGFAAQTFITDFRQEVHNAG